jgi:PAS domain S-box-containing protein
MPQPHTTIDYQNLFDVSPLPRLVISQKKKEHFFVQRANRAAINYFCPKPDGVCETIDDMPLHEFLDTTNTSHILQALSICFESGVPITIQVVPKGGHHLQVQSFMLSPVRDAQDIINYVDMQARPPALEQAAVERERDDAISMFTTVFDVSEVGITVTDHHGRFVRVNDTFLNQTGWDAIDLIGEELYVIIPEEDHDKAGERHQAALREKRKNYGEIRILKKDGSHMNVMVTSVMLELSNGRSFRVSTVVDVTELKQIEQDLRRAKDEADEANKAKSAFLANMSHELRTPLNAIIGFSEMMINGTLGQIDNEHYLEYLDDIKFSAQHLLQIINDVLDMSKIEAGKMPLDEEVIDIVSLLDSVRRLMIAKAEDKKVKVEIEADKNLQKLQGDERLIRQVFLNLVSNAVKFSHEGGEIKIHITCNENGLRIDVIDHGIGIPQERIAEVMEPFGQVHTNPKINKGQGTGLGLPIAKAMMDMHDGTLSIQSDADKGTVVTCIFPENRIVK